MLKLNYFCLSYIYIFLSIPFNQPKIVNAFTNSEKCQQEWTQLLQTLTRGDPDELRVVISPFVNASLNTYVHKKSNNVPVRGWTVIHERGLKSTGLNALAFQVLQFIYSFMKGLDELGIEIGLFSF